MRRRLSTPVSAASAAVFRIGFGTVGVVLVARFFAHGWIEELYVAPGYHFTYPGFDWVRVWPGPGMYLHFALIGVASVGIAVGYRYRVSAAAFAVLLGYAEMIDRSLYLNHYYWLALTGAVIAFLPLHRVWSIDSRKGRVTGTTIPVGVLWLLRFQVGMVYFFAGLAKLNPDWLFEAQPLATWLPARSDLAVIGPLLDLGPTAFVASWLSMLFDLTIVAWLLRPQTRPYAYIVVTLFHTMTWILFPTIGLFPVVMTLSALIFFEPDWPMRLARRQAPVPEPGRGTETGYAKLVFAAVYVMAMVFIPLRHLVTPGDVATTGEGYIGSWQVMLTEKVGSVRFHIVDPETGDRWEVDTPGYLTERQRMVMAADPAMVDEVASLISDDNGGAPVEAEIWLTVNGRTSTQMTVGAGGNTQ